MKHGIKVRVINDTPLHGKIGYTLRWRATDTVREDYVRVRIEGRGDSFVFPLSDLELG